MELIYDSSEHYISTIKGDDVVKVLSVDSSRKPTFREIAVILRSAHYCNQGLGLEDDRVMGFSKKICVSSSSGCNGNIIGHERNCDSEEESIDGCDDHRFNLMTLKELQEICRVKQQKIFASKNHPKPDAESYSHLETLSRKRNCAFVQPIDSDSDLEETLGSWKSKLFKKAKVKKRHTASEETHSLTRTAVLHVRTVEKNGQDSGYPSLQSKEVLPGFNNIKTEALESDCDLWIKDAVVDYSICNGQTPMDLSGTTSTEVSEKADGGDLLSEEPSFVARNSPNYLFNSHLNEFQEMESAYEISVEVIKTDSSEIASHESPSSVSNNKLDNAHLCGSSCSSQELDGSSQTDYYTDRIPDRPIDHSTQITDLVANCSKGLISPAIVNNPSDEVHLDLAPDRDAGFAPEMENKVLPRFCGGQTLINVSNNAFSLDSDEQCDTSRTDSLNKDGDETKPETVCLDQALEGNAGFIGVDFVSKDGDGTKLGTVSLDQVPDENIGVLQKMPALLELTSNEDHSPSGTDSVSKHDDVTNPDMVYLAQFPERISGFVPMVESKMAVKLNNEESGEGMLTESSKVQISPDFIEDQYTSSSGNIYSHAQGSHPPTKLLSTRKAISPTSQEKLRLAADGEELYDNIQLPKHRKRICFEKWTKNKSSSAGAGLEEAEVMVSESIAKKTKDNQCGSPPLVMKGILKSLPNTVCATSCACAEGSSMLKRSHKAIEFSQRQMQDIESLATKLLKELRSMKSIIAENLVSETSPKYTVDEMIIATESATELEETTRRWLSMMARDCNRFCKIMRLPEKKAAIADGFHKERKKICFADEAGGMLCHVKVFEDQG